MISPPRKQFTATVAANIPLCRDHFRLVLKLAEFPRSEPGQFIQIACSDVNADSIWTSPEETDWQVGAGRASENTELVSTPAMLRRPFSLAGRRDAADKSGVELDIIHRVVGKATTYLAELESGDGVDIIGPLGNAFELPGPSQIALLVGGGVGIPPMIYLAEKLAGRAAVAFAGAVSGDLLPLTHCETEFEVHEFWSHKIPTVLATDDGSLGFRGFVTEALEEFLDNRLATQIPRDGLQPIIYTCGPEPMMKRVGEIALQRGIPCQIAVERAMACGMGTCQSCCIRVRKPDPAAVPLPGRDWCYRLACTDGPIFMADQLLW
jgi:dihydroorotate dehydrogenase electron transfer subunit